MYLPPRRLFIPYPGFHRLTTRNSPAYITGDLNATSQNVGCRHTNQVGRQLDRMLNNGLLHHLGPDFPTFYTRNSHTTPDIVLCNNKVSHNISIKPRPITLSDHIPLIISLTTKAIMKDMPTILNMKNIDWESFKEEIENKMNNIKKLNNLSKEGTEEKLNKWFDIIENTMKNKIPTITQVIDQKPITSPQLDLYNTSIASYNSKLEHQGGTLQTTTIIEHYKQLYR